MKVQGINNIKLGTLVDQVKSGSRFVVYPWSAGLLFKVATRTSPARLVRSADWPRRLAYAFLTATLGWWALPAGPKVALRNIRQTLKGGTDVTAQVLDHIWQVKAFEKAAHADLQQFESQVRGPRRPAQPVTSAA